MTQRNNPYLQNRFDDNDQPTAPRRAGGNNAAPRRAPRAQLLKEKLMTKFTENPVLAATGLMLAGAAFATIIITSYPSGNNTGDTAPVIQADAQPFRDMQTDTASNEAGNEGSTIYSTLRSQGLTETAPIENLLDQEQPVERPTPSQLAEAKPLETTTPAVTATATTPAAKTTTTTTTTAKTVDVTTPEMPPQAAPAATTPAAATTTQTSTATQAEPLQHAAGESPDTLAFVQSVLDKKDGRVVDTTATAPATTAAASTTSGAVLNNVKPASGGTFAPGTFYVQLGSVSSRTGADSEFKKMQKNFAGTGLENTSYRVQEASVADKGTFYRIQAGPMSKESAGRLCDSIKAKSPGGCLIVQQ